MLVEQVFPGLADAQRLVTIAGMKRILGLFFALAGFVPAQVVFKPPAEAPQHGKRVALLAGDEEYRSEEGLPMLAKILSQRHGFYATVVLPINPDTGEIDPNNQRNLPGLAKALKDADVIVMLWRFRDPGEEGLKAFEEYYLAGKPIIALRTSTHAFDIKDKSSRFAKWSWNSSAPWKGGFGQQVLGDTWISHHGDHGKESTRGIIEDSAKDHPLLRGVKDVWGPSDVYGIVHLPKEATILLRGQVVAGMKPTDPPVEGPKNNPMQPLAWTLEHKNEAGTVNRVVTTTMGAATDLECEDLRRFLINAVYWLTGLEVPEKADARTVGEYRPSPFSFNGFKKGVKPSDLGGEVVP